MTKAEYLQLREENSLQILYNYYTEHFNRNKHNPFLSVEQFIMFLNMWTHIPNLFNTICSYYNEKFQINELRDKEGRLIKYV